MTTTLQTIAPNQSGSMLLHLLSPNTIPAISQQVLIPIGPEDLEIHTPPRMTATQTLNGIWIDHFGPGMTNLSISGTTGVQPNRPANGAVNYSSTAGSTDPTQLGSASIAALYDIYLQYADSVRKSENPASVTLTLSTILGDQDSPVYTIVPQDFYIRRSKTSPLLYRYQMPCIVVSDNVNTLTSTFPPAPINYYVGENSVTSAQYGTLASIQSAAMAGTQALAYSWTGKGPPTPTAPAALLPNPQPTASNIAQYVYSYIYPSLTLSQQIYLSQNTLLLSGITDPNNVALPVTLQIALMSNPLDVPLTNPSIGTNLVPQGQVQSGF